MNDKPKLKVKHKVEEIIRFIELNDLENVKRIFESSRKILKKKNMDDNEPINYAIKYKCNKIFKFILENSDDINYDFDKLFTNIIVNGTAKMFKYFVDYYKVDMNKCNRKFINLIFEEKVFFIYYFYNSSTIQILLNETNFSFSYTIPKKLYELFKYNFKTTEELKLENTVTIIINNGNLSDKNEIFNLDSKFNGNDEEKLKILFERYHKLFLIMKKGLKLPQNLQFRHYTETAKYI